MRVIEDGKRTERSTAVALGNFDGIHLGHIELLKACRNVAETKGLEFAVLTFDKKLTELKQGGSLSCLTSRAQKEAVFKELGVELLYIAEFDEKLKSMEPELFMEKILKEKLNASEVFVGFNFRFGINASGDSALLIEKGDVYGFKTNIVEPVKRDGDIISSSAIREHIRSGNIEKANTLLGRPYEIRGKVVRGKGRGKVMGFATANLKPETDYLPPKYGVYKTETKCRGEIYSSLTNVGRNPTFGDISFSIETHILEFEDDIYEEDIIVRFMKFIREEVKFSTVENLISQVKSDIAEVERED